MIRKSIVFIVLAIPVLIAVILRFFGQNKFEIPVYYREGVTNTVCNLSTEEEYRANVIQAENGVTASWRNGINLVHFYDENDPDEMKILEEFDRIWSTMDKNELLKVYIVSNRDIQLNSGFNYKILIFDSQHLKDFAECTMLISEVIADDQTYYDINVLLDGEGRIRGYYNIRNAEEFDRISAEIDILKMEYEGNKL